MKKILIVLLFSFCLTVNASEFQNVDYKNIKDGAKISVTNGIWTTKVSKKLNKYYVKKVSDGADNYSEFYSPNNAFLFSTATQYEFINKGSLIGYSNHDLKFYEFTLNEGLLRQRELLPEEVQELFPKYKILLISKFSHATNSLKIKKRRGNLKIILLNDTDRYFYNYGFTTNNACFKPYQLRGIIDITKKGLIQFSHFGDNTKNTPWFVILVR